MTDARYQLAISISQIGNDLAGAPLSVEIVPESGRARRALVKASGEPVVEELPASGRYLVRTTLPSGRRVVDVATVPEQPDSSGIARGAVVLDLVDDAVGGVMPAKASAVPTGRRGLGAWVEGAGRGLSRGNEFLASATSSVRAAVGTLGDLVSGNYMSHRSVEATVGAQGSLPAMHSGTRAISSSVGKQQSDRTITYDWDTFVQWELTGHSDAAPKLIARHGGTGTVEPDGFVRPPTNEERSLLIKVSEPSAGEAVIAWLPNSQGRPARVQIDSDGAALRSGSPLLAYNGQEDPITATLFSYIRSNALEDARTALPELIRNLQSPHVRFGPNQSTLAAYVLYKLRDRHAEHVIKDLCERYPELPDGHVLRGAQLISNGQAGQASQHFDSAIRYGLPTYTEGVRLLRDGSNFLRDLDPSDSHVRDNARLANRIAAAANFKSELTCLRVGRDIAVGVARNADNAGTAHA